MENMTSSALDLAVLRLKRAVQQAAQRKKEADLRVLEVEQAAEKVLERLNQLLGEEDQN